jgi:hypothetical protein
MATDRVIEARDLPDGGTISQRLPRRTIDTLFAIKMIVVEAHRFRFVMAAQNARSAV